jgi:hypothetical protein
VNSAGNVSFLTGGASYIVPSFHGEVYTWDNTGTFCNGSTGTYTGLAQVNVNPPDHVKVVSDNQLYPLCPPGSKGPAVYVRQIYMQLVDVNNVNVTTNYFTYETFPSMGYNTCGNGSPNPQSCISTGPTFCQGCTGGQFSDTLSVAGGGGSGNFCNSGINPTSGCGFSSTSSWGMCSNSLNNTVWTDPRQTNSNKIWIENQAANWPPGTIFH